MYDIMYFNKKQNIDFYYYILFMIFQEIFLFFILKYKFIYDIIYLIIFLIIFLRQYRTELVRKMRSQIFVGKSCKNFAGILSYVKKFLCDITENMQADFVQSRHASFVRYCLKTFREKNVT